MLCRQHHRRRLTAARAKAVSLAPEPLPSADGATVYRHSRAKSALTPRPGSEDHALRRPGRFSVPRELGGSHAEDLPGRSRTPIAVLVVVQAGAIAWAFFGLTNVDRPRTVS